MAEKIYRMLEELNGEKGGKRIILSYAQYQGLKMLVLVYLMK